jgi:hypothetical protein
MSRKINNDEWDDAVGRVNQPPEVPREQMWQAIDDARRDKRQVVDLAAHRRDRDWRSRITGPWRSIAAVAAILIIGIAIGRQTMAPDSTGVLTDSGNLQVAEQRDPVPVNNEAAAEQVDRLAAANLFGRADFLLTDFKVRSCAQQNLGEAPDWASGMLSQTRLLLDTPVAKDPEMNRLLEELELVLAQIVGLSRNNCARDMAWIKQGLQERSTLDRLRMMSDSRAQGAL